MLHSTPIHILLADDDEDDRLIFKDALERIRQPTRITLVNDGAQLMQFLSDLPPEEMPSIVFLDLNMPKKNGHECLREIRNTNHLKYLTVAIYSTSATEEDIENTFVMGANVYIKKPNDFNQLVRILSEVMKISWQYHTSDLNKDNFVLRV